jgi:drug/metabolite transporter (DMT)-like permease
LTPVAVVFVLFAAFLHAFWNLLSKRLGDDARGLGYPWLLSVISAALYAPVGVLVAWQAGGGAIARSFGWMIGTALLHVVYLLALQRGYRTGDFSVVYPVARGIGPLLSTAGAILLLGERPTTVAIAGAVLVASGILLVAGVGGTRFGRAGIGWAALTGLTIGAYTLWDTAGVRRLAIPVLLYDWMGHVVRAMLLTAGGARMFRHEVRPRWRAPQGTLLLIGLLSPLAYIFVLMAVRISPVSQVAPLREVGILVGAWLGVRVLDERERKRRLIAAVLVCAGVLFLAFG